MCNTVAIHSLNQPSLTKIVIPGIVHAPHDGFWLEKAPDQEVRSGTGFSELFTYCDNRVLGQNALILSKLYYPALYQLLATKNV